VYSTRPFHSARLKQLYRLFVLTSLHPTFLLCRRYGVHSIAINTFVYLYVCLSYRISQKPHFSEHVTCGRGSVHLWQQCNRLCRPTSNFVDDVWRHILHNGANGPHSKRQISSSLPGGGTGRSGEQWMKHDTVVLIVAHSLYYRLTER